MNSNSTKVALVTGASRGIGRGIAQALDAAGFSVVVNYAGNLAAAEETAASLQHKALILQGDVASAQDRERIVTETLNHFGRVDVLVNNAGITSVGRKDILEADESSWDTVLGVNLKGPYFLSQRVAQAMIAQAIPGTIINISSLSAISASINRGDYCISKAGMVMMTQLFALRLAEHGIRVFEVRPGIIDTDMTAAARDRYQKRIEEGLTPVRRLGTPRDVGQVVAMLVNTDLPYCTGDTINVDGGFHLRKL